MGGMVGVLIEILNTITKLVSSIEVSSLLHDSASSYAFVPMETDLEHKKFISVDGDESSRETSEMGVDNSTKTLYSNMESFILDCISNATLILESILHTTDRCGVFIEKKGIEALLQVFGLHLLPLKFASGQNITIAFKNF